MSVKQLPSEAQKYKNEWVALFQDDRVVGHGKTPSDALTQAKEAGLGAVEVDLIFIPEEWPKALVV